MKIKVFALCTVLFSVSGCLNPHSLATGLDAITSPYHQFAPNDANRGCVYKDTGNGLEWVCPGYKDPDEYSD